MPALLNRTSYRPWRSTPAATARATASSSVTSATALDACSAPSSPTAASSLPSSIPTRCTRAPSTTNSRAVARPIPLSPPVISATLSSSRAIAPPLRSLARATLSERRARRRVDRRGKRVDAAVRARRVRRLLRAADDLVEKRAGVGEAVDARRAGGRALVRARGERVAERAAQAVLAPAGIAEAGLVPPEAPVEERRTDERLARQPDDLERDLLRAAIAQVVEAQLTLVDASAAAAAVADGQREVLAPELEVLDGPAGRGAGDARVDVAGAGLRDARQALRGLRARRRQRLRVDDRVRLAALAVIARPRDPPAPDRRAGVVVVRVVGVADRPLAGAPVECVHEQVAPAQDAGARRAALVDQLRLPGRVRADVGVERPRARRERQALGRGGAGAPHRQEVPVRGRVELAEDDAPGELAHGRRRARRGDRVGGGERRKREGGER